MYQRDQQDIEMKIRDPDRIIIEKITKKKLIVKSPDNHDKAPINYSGNHNNSAVKSQVNHDKSPGYQFDMKNMMVTQRIKPIDLKHEAKPKADAKSLKHHIPRFEEVNVFWDAGVPMPDMGPPPPKDYNFHIDTDKDSPAAMQKRQRIVVQNNVTVASGSRFAVISCVPEKLDQHLNYAFNLPMIVYFWQRLGFRTVAILIGSEDAWMARRTTALILQQLRATDAIVVFLDVADKHGIMMAQVGRLFVPLILEWHNRGDIYLVVSDADLFPLMHGVYDLPAQKKILALNSECCGNFKHDGYSYKMLPMCNIGMNVSTWCEVMRFHPDDRLLMPEQMVEYVATEMGEVARTAVSKGENDGWYLDQHLVSVRLAQWAVEHSSDEIAYIRRDTGRDRIDRDWGWNPYVTHHIKDAHLFGQIFKPGVWERLRPLMYTYFDIKSDIGQRIENYRDQFLKIYLNSTSEIS